MKAWKPTTKPGQTKARNRKRTQKEHKRPSQKNQQGRRNKITTFLEKKRRTPKQSSNSYITLNENGHPIEDPAQAKEHIAQYVENQYQAREGRPQYAEWTKEIKTTIKRMTESDEMKEDIDPILTTEITEAIHKLKNGKATGPDEISNEIFTKAEPQTIEVYRKALQTIADSRDIPEQWQKGQIIRLYKGKGKRGKCSNERGITLASNFGKLFERILNKRAKEKINITENQARGQKGKATTDHLVVLRETIKEIRKQKKTPVYMVFLDVTKGYDKAWLDAIMYLMHKKGLKGPQWDLVKKMNENLTAQLSTRHGNTREIRGGGLLIDEINKEITKENLGTHIESLDETIGCLLWMDDVLLISSEPMNSSKC